MTLLKDGSDPLIHTSCPRYGQSPTGALRFKKPEKFEAGEAVFDVSGESEVMCTQWNDDYTAMVGQEDCLLLNVYVPADVVDEGGNVPVMVWIHGGAFMSGSGTYADYGPQYFMDQGDAQLQAGTFRVPQWRQRGPARQPGTVGPGSGSHLGQGQHTALRGRRRPAHSLRGVGRWGEVRPGQH